MANATERVVRGICMLRRAKKHLRLLGSFAIEITALHKAHHFSKEDINNTGSY